MAEGPSHDQAAPGGEAEDAAPVRLERDGNVAVMILQNPPLNLFTGAAWQGVIDVVEALKESDARAFVWRAEGEIFTGGVDVELFQKAQEEGVAGEAFGSLIETARKLEELEIPTLALVHGLCLPRGSRSRSPATCSGQPSRPSSGWSRPSSD